VLIPTDCANPESMMIVLDLGHFWFKNEKDLSKKRPKEIGMEGEDEEDEEDEFFDVQEEFSDPETDYELRIPSQPSKDSVNYDCYLMSLSSVQVISTKISQNWKDVQEQKKVACLPPILSSNPKINPPTSSPASTQHH